MLYIQRSEEQRHGEYINFTSGQMFLWDPLYGRMLSQPPILNTFGPDLMFPYITTFVSSVRSSSGYHGLLLTRSAAAAATHFFRFFKFFRFKSESESERTQHVLYFLKAWDSRISNMTSPCIKCKIHKYINMQIYKYKVLKRPYMCYIF